MVRKSSRLEYRRMLLCLKMFATAPKKDAFLYRGTAWGIISFCSSVMARLRFIVLQSVSGQHAVLFAFPAQFLRGRQRAALHGVNALVSQAVEGGGHRLRSTSGHERAIFILAYKFAHFRKVADNKAQS